MTLNPAEMWELDGLENGGHTVQETLRWVSECMDIEDRERHQRAETPNVVMVSPDLGGSRRRWRWRRR